MINLNSISLVEVVHLIELEVLAHLPHLHGHLSVDTDSHELIPVEWTPANIFNVVLLVQLMREYHLGGSILVVVTGLLLPAVVVVPHEHLAICGGGHEEVLTRGGPVDLAHWALMIGQVVDEVLRHTHIPDVQDTRLLSTCREEVL